MVTYPGSVYLSLPSPRCTHNPPPPAMPQVLPIAVVILGCTLRSYRHMGVALCTLGCTILLSFALLVPASVLSSVRPPACLPVCL